MENVILREGNISDFPFYYALKCEHSDKYWMGFREDPDRDSLKECFADRINCAYNAGSGGKLIKIVQSCSDAVGYVQFTFNEDDLELGISISESSQGVGIGTESIKLAIKWLNDLNEKREIFARIREDNAASQKCFSKCNFIRTEIYENIFYPYVEKDIHLIRYVWDGSPMVE